MLVLAGNLKLEKKYCVGFFSFKLYTDSFIRSICHNVCMLISSNELFLEINLLGMKGQLNMYNTSVPLINIAHVIRFPT